MRIKSILGEIWNFKFWVITWFLHFWVKTFKMPTNKMSHVFEFWYTFEYMSKLKKKKYPKIYKKLNKNDWKHLWGKKLNFWLVLSLCYLIFVPYAIWLVKSDDNFWRFYTSESACCWNKIDEERKKVRNIYRTLYCKTLYLHSSIISYLTLVNWDFWTVASHLLIIFFYHVLSFTGETYCIADGRCLFLGNQI